MSEVKVYKMTAFESNGYSVSAWFRLGDEFPEVVLKSDYLAEKNRADEAGRLSAIYKDQRDKYVEKIKELYQKLDEQETQIKVLEAKLAKAEKEYGSLAECLHLGFPHKSEILKETYKKTLAAITELTVKERG